MPEITCPRCGYSLESAGSVATTCPRCESGLQFEEAKPVKPAVSVRLSDDSGPKLDVAALMRRVMAEQQPGEDLHAALERTVQGEGPGNREKIIKTIEWFLSFRQQRFGISRQEAAQLLAQSMAQLTIMPDGNPFLVI